MASAREERIQQRLRGAQRRQVKDVDFGLTFPVMPAVPAVPAVPAPAQQTTPSQPSPQPELAPGLSTQASSTGRSSIARVTEENGVPIIRNSANDANTSAKRRKLDTDQAASSSTRSTRSSLRASRPDIYDLPEDDARESPAANIMNRPVGQDADVGQDEPKTIPEYESRPGVSQTPPSRPAPVIEEVTESPKDAPGSGHRTRLYLHEATLQSSQLLHQLQDINTTDAESIDTSPVLRRKRKRGETTPKRLVSSDERPRHSKGGQPDIEELDELSPEQLRGRSREPKQLVREKVSNVEVEEEEVAKDSTEEAEEISDHEAAAALNENRGRRISRNRAVESPDLDESSIRTPTVPQKGRGKARRISEPAQQRQPRKALQPKAKANSKTSKKASKSSKLRIGSPIPITVHRFTRRPLYDDEESDADILNSEIPYIKRGGVNPIDVLSQVCHEIIDSGLSTLEEGSNKSNDSALRREYKTKWRAVEAFGKELQDRLLEHTINLENTFSLERRVREELKKKLTLREDIRRIRAEREQIALRMDEIRIKHEKETKDAQERDSLNNTIHDIELAIERGKEQHPHDSTDSAVEMTGMELLLKRVAGEVSNKSDSGGMLKQIKDFNAFLERAALALETRKS